MNISKFILIDIALILATTPLLFFLQGGYRKTTLSQSSNIDELLKDVSIKLPNKEKLIELEKNAKNEGSGIDFNALLGDWKFVSLWKKNIDKEDNIFSSLLKIFSAKIKFIEEISNKKSPELRVVVSIQFGIITIEFSGTGYLKGKQPLLIFFLNIIELKSGPNILISRSIAVQKEAEKTFFALIGLEENGQWLSARGQGGSLVIWLKD